MEPNASVYVLKVVLEADKKIWRRIAIRADQTLDDLHEMIFRAFDRDEEHLYSFYFPMSGSRGRAALRDAREYTCPYNGQEHSALGKAMADFLGEPAERNAAKTPLGSLKLKHGQTLKYLFDFGDSWWHEITVEAVDAPGEQGPYPRTLERHGESPPQYPDCEE